MTNWIICPACGGLDMTLEAIASFQAQDIGDVAVCLIDNGYNDEFFQHDWMAEGVWYTRSNMVYHDPMPEPVFRPQSVACVWNQMLDHLFNYPMTWHDHTGTAPYVLVCNNDIVLRPDTYRLLVADGGLFVTPVGTDDRSAIDREPKPEEKAPHPDFGCFLIRKECFERAGPFDERFEGAYCEDADYHIRMHRAGIDAYSINVPYYHRVNGTLKANPERAAAIHRQADKNRAYFRSKWGCLPGDQVYYSLFGD